MLPLTKEATLWYHQWKGPLYLDVGRIITYLRQKQSPLRWVSFHQMYSRLPLQLDSSQTLYQKERHRFQYSDLQEPCIVVQRQANWWNTRFPGDKTFALIDGRHRIHLKKRQKLVGDYCYVLSQEELWPFYFIHISEGWAFLIPLLRQSWFQVLMIYLINLLF